MKKDWHILSLSDIFLGLESSENGLKTDEVNNRIKNFGRNVLPEEKSASKIKLFLSQFNNSLIYILLVADIISFALGHYSDSILIIIVLLINGVVGFYQEDKANKSLAALKKMVKINVKVIRDGYEKEVDSENLVIGDVILLKPGDKVPADARIINSSGLRVNESNLTGEWLAVDKNVIEGLPKDMPLSERKNMVFMGTIVEDGWGSAVIVATGVDAQMGQVFSMLKETKEEKTPLQKKVLNLSRFLGLAIILVIVIIVIEGYFTGESFIDIFIAALALAVSAIPEGLVPTITVILVLGMRRILREKGLVRKLSATETLGSVTVICTDKTGTLTEGNMKVSHILTSTRELMDDEIEGSAKKEEYSGVESHISALKIALLTNEGFVENPDAELQEWVIRGKPTEKALLLAGMQAGLSRKELELEYPVVDKIIFGSENKFAATLHKKDKKHYVLYVIGAPEILIEKCTHLDIDGGKEKLGKKQDNELLSKFNDLTHKGLRVLACAHKEYSINTKYNNLQELVKDLSLVGFIAIKDPLRPDAKKSIAITKEAGIRTVIITGDHKFTAQAIAKEIGIQAEDENIIEGNSIESITEKELMEKVKSLSIYARVSPLHKLRIVNALQKNGEIVAMVGDGINDAVALKAADIGVAIGSGADVAKEVADLVLLDNNFKTIIKAIEQGRVIFQNIRKVFVYLIAGDFSEIFLFLSTVLLGMPLPLLPAQILWINIVEDGFPGIALSAEQETKGIMNENPRNPKEPILNKNLKILLSCIFIITGITALIFFAMFFNITGDIGKTRTLTFAFMCLDSLVFVFIIRSFKQTIFRKNIFSNKYLVWSFLLGLFLLIIAIYFPPLQILLSTQSLNFNDWIIIVVFSLINILLIEFSKKKIFSIL